MAPATTATENSLHIGLPSGTTARAPRVAPRPREVIAVVSDALVRLLLERPTGLDRRRRDHR